MNFRGVKVATECKRDVDVVFERKYFITGTLLRAHRGEVENVPATSAVASVFLLSAAISLRGVKDVNTT